jgi:uncharacterized protein YceK
VRVSASVVLAIALLTNGCASVVNEEDARTAQSPGSQSSDGSQRRPDAILGMGLYDNHFYMPFMLVRDENVTIDIELERDAPSGNVISCKLTSGDTTVSCDMGNACHLFASGNGLRHYVLHIYNVDEEGGHQVFINANRGRGHG